jgi:hypothetical protein
VKRFLHWRKMTWAIAAWSGAMLAWLVGRVATARDVGADCATDPAGAVATALTQRECLDAAGLGTGGSIVLIAALWLLGAVGLTAIWLLTRPLWRQGHGARLRRLRPDEMPWIYDAPVTQRAAESRLSG